MCRRYVTNKMQRELCEMVCVIMQELFTSNALAMLLGVAIAGGAIFIATSSLTITMLATIVLILLNFNLAVLIPTITGKFGVSLSTIQTTFHSSR